MWLVVTLVPLPSEVLVTCRPMSKHWTWFPSEVHTSTGRLCSAGSRGPLFPNVHARMQPSDSLPPSATAPVPLAGGLPRCGRLFCAHGADDTCARPRVVRRRRVTGSPPRRSVSRRGEGLPGYGAVLFVCAMVEHPAGYAPLLAHVAQRALWPSGHSAPWASGKVRGFGAACPMAHTFACLRIAGVISGTVARLATGSSGFTLRRAGFAPAGRLTKFREGIVSSLPFDQHCLVALNFLSARCRLSLTVTLQHVWKLYPPRHYAPFFQ